MNPTVKLTAVSLTALFASSWTLAADYTMRISHQYPPTHQVAKAIEQFAHDIKSGTGGKVEVQIFGAEQLFKATQNHAAVARGEVEAAAVVSFLWGKTIPELNVVSIPYLMTSAEQLKKFPDSEAAAYLNGKFEEKGVKNIAWMVDANDGIFTSAKAPLIAPADFKGVKIRGLSKLLDTGFAAMGASPSGMPGSEVYQALQTGVIDATVTGVAAANARRLYEVQKYGVASAFTAVYANLVVNPSWWSGLPQPVRDSIQHAAQKAQETLLPTSDEVSPEDVKRLRDHGMEVTVLSKEQEATLAKIMQPVVIKEFTDSTKDGEKLIAMIKKL